MSGVSSSTALSVYLSTIKDEQTQVSRYVASDTQLASTVSSFTSTAATLTTPTAILSNYKALQVLTGAYNLSGQISQTAVLRDLLTQTADSSTSLVSETSNTDYLHFARATSDRNSQTASLGAPAAMSLVTSGASASSLTMQNTAWSLSGSQQTAAAPGVRWSFVLNDGSASASIASALQNAAAATDSDATYSVTASGTITASPGAPAVTTSTDSAGNTVYSLALATDATGAVTKKADIVSVKTAPAGPSGGATQLAALQGAVTAAGFDATVSAGGGFTIIDPSTNGTNTLARSFGTAIAIATSSTLDASGRLDLGQAGTTLSPGQVLTDGSTEIGTVKSVDSFGNVTLDAPAATTISAGDTIQVVTGLGFANVGTTVAATADSAQGSQTLSLGKAGIGLQPGQIVTSGGVDIGTIGSIDGGGTVTLLAGSTQAVASGAPLVVLPAVSGGTTSALDDASNVKSIVSSYETDAYETQMGTEYPGMDNALYYTRTMGSITSITDLMANAKLLSVVTNALGMGSYFGALDYDQQVSLLTQKVNLKTMTSPAGIQQTAEQYLIADAATVSTQPTGLVALLAGDATSDTDLFSLINGVSNPSSGVASTTDPLLALFA